MTEMIAADHPDYVPAIRQTGQSQELVEAIQRVLNPLADLAHNPPVVTSATRREAEQRLRDLDAQMKPATRQQWTAFLKPLVFSVGNPPSTDEFAAKLSAILFGLNTIPASVLTEERSREAVRRFRFFPTGEDLDKWLSPFVRALHEERRALERLRRGVPPVTRVNPVERTEAEREHAAAVARAVDLAARKSTAESPSRSGHVQPLDMARQLRRDMILGMSVVSASTSNIRMAWLLARNRGLAWEMQRLGEPIPPLSLSQDEWTKIADATGYTKADYEAQEAGDV